MNEKRIGYVLSIVDRIKGLRKQYENDEYLLSIVCEHTDQNEKSTIRSSWTRDTETGKRTGHRCNTCERIIKIEESEKEVHLSSGKS